MKSQKNAFLFFSVMAVVAVSGCVIPGADVFQGLFEPQRPTTTEASADLITTQNLNIIPNPPISADNTFTISFEVKNNDENEEVKNVGVTMYDSGLCKPGKVTYPGVGESTENVQYTEGTNVTKFSVSCGGGVTDTLYLEEGVTVKKTVCGKTNDYKVSNLDAYTFYLYIDSHYEYFKYREVKTNEGETYNCLTGLGIQTPCTKIYNGISYTITEIKNYRRAKCIGSTVCTDDCSAVCEKQNADCKKDCDKYSGDAKAACLSQCDKYAVTVGVSEDAPCWAEFRPAKGFMGECCRCDYVTIGFPEGAPTPVVGAKTYYPLQTELFEWGFTAPSNKEIGNMPYTCPIRYKITYAFTAKTQTDVSVISKSKMEELQRAGQQPSASPTQSVSIGPIKIFFDFGTKQPIKSGDVLPVFITVEDKGSGVYSKVLAGKLKVKLPASFEKISCDKFSDKGGGVFENSAEIPLIKKKSPQMRCSFKMPSVTDIKTFYITGELAYDYKLDEEIKVSVNPTLVK